VDEVRKWGEVSPNVRRNTLDRFESRQQEVVTSYMYMARGYAKHDVIFIAFLRRQDASHETMGAPRGGMLWG
jgi:hypothetical protein